MLPEGNPSTPPLAEALIGPGFYKLGYVTTDLEQAIDLFTRTLGFGAFARFAPSMEVTTGDGKRGPASLRCAFSTGRELVVELMQPLDGLVDVFREPLATADEFAIAFHHTGILVDDLERVKAQLPTNPAWESWLPGRMGVTYTRIPALGHYVEHVEYRGDGGDFLASVRSRAQTSPAPPPRPRARPGGHLDEGRQRHPLAGLWFRAPGSVS
jgi:catechol 2,3-dioxygenase-like lactoylglutathione lyase family enzyme